MKKNILFTLLIFIFPFANAQIIQSFQFIKGSLHDGEKLMKAYLLPVENSFSTINGSGLIHPEPITKKFSFKVTVDFMEVTAPISDRTYDVNKLQLAEFKLSDPNRPIAQTFAGGFDSIKLETKSTYRVPTISYPFYTEKPLASFYTPKGITRTIPFAAIGIAFSTQSNSLAFRVLPPLSLPGIDGKISLVGLTAQTKINKLFSSLNHIPFDIIISCGFEKIQLNINPNLKPMNSTDREYDNQKFFIHSTVIPLQVAISKIFFHNFNVFVNGGKSIAFTNTGLAGIYPLYKSDPTDSYNIIIDKIKDPIEYARNNSALFLKLGVGYYLKRIGFNGEFSFAKYKSMCIRVNVYI